MSSLDGRVIAIAGAVPTQVDILDARRHYERFEAIRCRLRFPNGMDVDVSASRIATRASSSREGCRSAKW